MTPTGGKLDLLLKKQTPVLGISFRPPCRISDIRSYSWPGPEVKSGRLRLQMSENAPVICPANGRITFLDNSRTAKIFTIEISHSPLVKSVLRGVLAPVVHYGDYVKIGQIIGKSYPVLDILIYVKLDDATLSKSQKFLRDITGRSIWSEIFTPLPVIGKGGVDAITNK